MKDPILVVCSLLGESCWDLWGKWVLSAFSQTTYFHVDYLSMINFPRRLHPRLWDCERALVWGRLWGLQYFAKNKIKLVSVANTPNSDSIICLIDDCLVGPDSSDTWHCRHQISAANVRLLKSIKTRLWYHPKASCVDSIYSSSDQCNTVTWTFIRTWHLFLCNLPSGMTWSTLRSGNMILNIW